MLNRAAASSSLQEGELPAVEGEEADMARTFLQDFEEFQKHDELINP